MTTIGAVGMLVRASLRRGRGSVLVAVGLVALVSAAVLTSGAAAHRTATVLDRWEASYPIPDVTIGVYGTGDVSDVGTLRTLEAELRDLPGVTRAVAMPNIYLPIGPLDENVGVQVAVPPGPGEAESFQAFERFAPKVLDGRLPADTGDELVVDEHTAELLDIGVGDVLSVPTVSQETAEAMMVGEVSEPALDGPELRFEVVGVFRSDLEPQPDYAYGVASADTSRFLGRVASTDTAISVDGEDGTVDVDRALGLVAEAFPGAGVYAARADDTLEPFRTSFDMIAVGLWLFALVALVAGLVSLGLVLEREIARSASEIGAARALGMRDGAIASALALPPILAAFAGVVLGALASVALSPLFPTSVARRAEVAPGVRVDWTVLLVGAAVLLVVIAAVAVLAARRQLGRRASGSEPSPRRVGALGVWKVFSVPAGIGVGAVVAPTRARSAASPGSAVVGAVLGVAGVLAIAVFVGSQQAAVSDPARYGWGWDADIELTQGAPEQAIEALSEDPRVTAVGVATCGDAALEDERTSMCALTVVSGSLSLTYLDGRPPTSPDEIALGERSMSDHGLAIGDDVRLAGDGGSTQDMTVVGVAVQPDEIAPGRGAIATPDGFAALMTGGSGSILVLEYPPGADIDATDAALAEDYGFSLDSFTHARPPGSLAQLERVRSTLVALAAFLASVGVVGLSHFLLISGERRRHDTAVLSSLGFVRSQTMAVVLWQALTVVAIGLVVGVPVGVLIGRSVWLDSVDQLGIVDAPAMPWLVGALVVGMGLLGAALVSLPPAWKAARRTPVEALREE